MASCSVTVKPNHYTLYFDARGGSVSETYRVLAPNATFGSLPTPTREGFSFNGWYFSDGSAAGSSSSIGEADVTVYASWSVLYYSLSFSSGTGYSISVNRTSSPLAAASTGNLSSGSTIYYGDTLSISYGASTGYSLTSSGITSATVTGNIGTSQIYASASPNNYTYSVYYCSTNGTNLGSDSITRAFGTTETITPKAFSGYTTPAAQSMT